MKNACLNNSLFKQHLNYIGNKIKSTITSTQPQFDDAKSQKAWERTRVLAIQNAPDVSI